MTTLNGIKVVVYTKNKAHLQKFLENLSDYFSAIPCTCDLFVHVVVYKHCLYVHISYERVCMDKDEEIQDYKKIFEDQILKDCPSLYAEFFMWHWHLRGYRKEFTCIGKESFAHKESLMESDVFTKLGKCVDVSHYFYTCNENMSGMKPKIKDFWRPGIDIHSYIDKYGKEEEFPAVCQSKEEKFWGECQISDD